MSKRCKDGRKELELELELGLEIRKEEYRGVNVLDEGHASGNGVARPCMKSRDPHRTIVSPVP